MATTKPERVSAEDILAAFKDGAISARQFGLLKKPKTELDEAERDRVVGALAQVRLYVKRRDRKYQHQSDADKQAASVSRRYDVEEVPAVADPSRRRRCERSALYFMREYCTGIGRNGFLKTNVPASMRKIVHTMQLAIETGVPYHIRMPRGHGKTSYVKGVVMWALATGKAKLVEAVAANARKAEGIVRDVWNCLANSRRFGDDFPEIATFIRKCRGNWRRAPFVTYKGEAVGMSKNNGALQLPAAPVDGVLPKSANAVMFAVGFSANVRGEVIGDQRPDLLIFDDLQDRDIANNPEQVQEKFELVNGDFLGGDAHTDVSSAFMTSTPIKPDDLSERFASDPYWRTQTFRLFERFPDCFDPMSNEGLWQDFWRVWQHENKVMGRDPHPACNDFYRAHRAEMDAGAKVLNEGNFRKNEVSAIEHGMILYFRNPKTFAAEYQMEPVRDEAIYTIDEQTILAHVRDGSFAGDVPDGTVMVCAATDINPSYALSTVAVALDSDRSVNVIDYWLTPCSIPGDATDTEFVRAVYDNCVKVGRELRERGIDVTSKDFHWGVDASGNQAKSVLKLAQEARGVLGFDALALMGRTDKEFNPRVGTRKYSTRPGVNDTVLCMNKATKQEYVLFNKDKYEESWQRAWIPEIGSPGGATLFAARRGYGPADHDEFLLQVCGEQLRAKTAAAQEKFVYAWKEKYRHDLGDAGYMTLALAGFFGLAAGGGYERKTADEADVMFL